MSKKWSDESMGMENGEINKKNKDESGRKSFKSVFEIRDIENPVDKLKSHVKGYSLTMVTERMLNKNKIGDALAAVCDMKELEDEIRESLKNGIPVYGFFKGKQMWSCFLFDMVDIPKEKLSPEPTNDKDILCICKLRKSYIHPDVQQVAEDMTEVAHKCVYDNIMDIFGDGKWDGFVYKEKVYVCRREKSTGMPLGFMMGIALGVLYGLIFHKLALGLCMGVSFGICFGMAYGMSTHTSVEHTMEQDTEIETDK